MLSLLAISFEPGEAPEGDVTLHFADGARHPAAAWSASRPSCKDLGPVWRVDVDAAASHRRSCHQRETPDGKPPAAGPSNPCPSTSTTTDPDFESAFAAFLATKREASEDVDAAVRAIIAQVRARRRRGRSSS